jgi:hypothetical protein
MARSKGLGCIIATAILTADNALGIIQFNCPRAIFEWILDVPGESCKPTGEAGTPCPSIRTGLSLGKPT